MSWWSLTVITPSRLTGSAFAETRNPTVPSPCPLVADVIEIQDDWLDAFQVQSRSTLTDTVPLPPVAPNRGAEDATLA